MLVRLFGENFRSLREPFELSMVAADLGGPNDKDRGVFEVKLDGEDEPLRLLRVVGVYGHNGAGKSTVLSAASALSFIVLTSSQRAKPGMPIPVYEPFKLDKTSRDAPIRLGCEVTFGGRILRYELEYGNDFILAERLTEVAASGEETPIIDRRVDNLVGGTLIEQSEANKLYVREMQRNVSVLSKLAQHGPAKGDESAMPYFTAILGSLNYRDFTAETISHLSFMGDGSHDLIVKDAKFRRWMMTHLMRPADVGIADVRTSTRKASYPEEVRRLIGERSPEFRLPEEEVVVSFVHQGDKDTLIPLDDQSAGTRKLFNIAFPWWQLSDGDRALFVDELSASLHPTILDALVRGVNERPRTEEPSQLIFATHDTSLMESRDGRPPALRRDQVYFVEKTRHGSSNLYALAEFKEGARPVHNIRKRYMSGKYGAIARVDGLPL